LPSLLHTLRAADFPHPFGFGIEDFFIAVSPRSNPLHFKYESLLPRVANQTLANLVSRQSTINVAMAHPGRINSVLFPLRFSKDDRAGQSWSNLNVSPVDSGDFLPLFLNRFSSRWKHEAGLANHDMSLELQKFWQANMAEPRPFLEEILPGQAWPRFQWGLESRTSTIMPVFQWIDVKHSERLRKEWSQAYCMSDNSAWFGVRWAGDKSVVEFFVSGNLGISIRRYENGTWLGEFPLKFVESKHRWIAEFNGQILWTEEAVGILPPQPTNLRAAAIQDRIQHEFLINPRTVASGPGFQRFYFP
jgi:hypothetical protein